MIRKTSIYIPKFANFTLEALLHPERQKTSPVSLVHANCCSGWWMPVLRSAQLLPGPNTRWLTMSGLRGGGDRSTVYNLVGCCRVLSNSGFSWQAVGSRQWSNWNWSSLEVCSCSAPKGIIPVLWRPNVLSRVNNSPPLSLFSGRHVQSNTVHSKLFNTTVNQRYIIATHGVV